MSETITVPETIIQRKIIVFKPAVGIKTIRNIANKAKNQTFKKYFLFKTKPEETKIDTIDRYFEPYIVIAGKYSIDYSKSWNYSIKVNEEMQKLKISNKNFEPKLLENHLELPYKNLELNGTGRFYHESRLRMILDKEGNEVGLEHLPYLSFEENPLEILDNTNRHLLEKEFKTENEVEILRSRIFKRPTDIVKVFTEIFKVTERALIYKPMYKVSVSHNMTKKKVTFLVDGSTGRITSKQKDTLKPLTKVLRDKMVEPYSIFKHHVEKFFNFIKMKMQNIFTF